MKFILSIFCFLILTSSFTTDGTSLPFYTHLIQSDLIIHGKVVKDEFQLLQIVVEKVLFGQKNDGDTITINRYGIYALIENPNKKVGQKSVLFLKAKNDSFDIIDGGRAEYFTRGKNILISDFMSWHLFPLSIDLFDTTVRDFKECYQFDFDNPNSDGSYYKESCLKVWNQRHKSFPQWLLRELEKRHGN